ncbi:MAG: hypothetical protein HYS81_03325 [Candidatus Aenigmatarchaeota archaeon]|nr:MAG: hypothetical protein HYS81_03325 [Candidatus Aenigmarchaeota archaeon]
MKAETVQIIFLGSSLQMPRLKYLLRRYIPHKVYFISAKEDDDRKRKTVEQMVKTLKKEMLGWVAQTTSHVKMSFFDFHDSFPKLVELMMTERRQGKEVIINIHGCSIPLSIATLLAANLTGSKVFWVEPTRWGADKHGAYEFFSPTGAVGTRQIDLPIGLDLPPRPGSDVLVYMRKRGGVVRGRLAAMAQEIGLKALGTNIKKNSSGIVKLSKTFTRLRDSGFVKTRKVSNRLFEVSLTERGDMIGEVLVLLDPQQDNPSGGHRGP